MEAERCPGDLRRPEHDAAPVLPRLHPVDRGSGGSSCAERFRDRPPRVGAADPRGGGNGVVRRGSHRRRRRLVGVPQRGRLQRRAFVGDRRDRAPARVGRVDRGRRPAAAPGVRGRDRGRPVPLDRRAHPRGHLHRRARRRGVDHLHEPAGGAAARLRAGRVDRRPGSVAADRPPGRSPASDRREPASQRDRRIVLARLPRVSQGRADRRGSATRRGSSGTSAASPRSRSG